MCSKSKNNLCILHRVFVPTRFIDVLTTIEIIDIR